MKLALALLLIGTSGVSAAPYYVGQNLSQPNHVALGFQDTPTKKTLGGTSTGNIAAFDLKGNFNATEAVGIRASLPFYMTTKNANATAKSRNALGNVGLGMAWNDSFALDTKSINLGYALNLDAYLPTSRKTEASTPAVANAPTDLFKYQPRATTITPIAGLWAMSDMWSAKVNAGYAYSFIQKKSGTPTDQNRNNITTQVGASWHAMPNLHVNLEWNNIIMDTSTRYETTVNSKNTRWRHNLTPSVSGTYDMVIANAFVTVPLDQASRKASNVAFGANAGWTF
jgi:hypothetical protein